VELIYPGRLNCSSCDVELPHPTARRMQMTFASWQDLQSDFLIGREYWSQPQSETHQEEFRAIYERFLKDPFGPWIYNAWASDLKVATPLSIEAN
jgi:hypothetical protein